MLSYVQASFRILSLSRPLVAIFEDVVSLLDVDKYWVFSRVCQYMLEYADEYHLAVGILDAISFGSLAARTRIFWVLRRK